MNEKKNILERRSLSSDQIYLAAPHARWFCASSLIPSGWIDCRTDHNNMALRPYERSYAVANDNLMRISSRTFDIQMVWFRHEFSCAAEKPRVAKRSSRTRPLDIYVVSHPSEWLRAVSSCWTVWMTLNKNGIHGDVHPYAGACAW